MLGSQRHRTDGKVQHFKTSQDVPLNLSRVWEQCRYILAGVHPTDKTLSYMQAHTQDLRNCPLPSWVTPPHMPHKTYCLHKSVWKLKFSFCVFREVSLGPECLAGIKKKKLEKTKQDLVVRAQIYTTRSSSVSPVVLNWKSQHLLGSIHIHSEAC